MEPREKGFIEGCNTVGGEEDNALVILKVTQKDGDDGVALYVFSGALFKENVCLQDEGW